ncbi:MAG: hypothetical protein K8E66_00805, partial [Phycisphaerales bacterium]|nr:hypothetical protein [Phycisphaerales bacterium]
MMRCRNYILAALGGALIAAAPMAASLGVVCLTADRASARLVGEDLDKIILRSGKVIEGRILRETADEVRMEVI